MAGANDANGLAPGRVMKVVIGRARVTMPEEGKERVCEIDMNDIWILHRNLFGGLLPWNMLRKWTLRSTSVPTSMGWDITRCNGGCTNVKVRKIQI